MCASSGTADCCTRSVSRGGLCRWGVPHSATRHSAGERRGGWCSVSAMAPLCRQ
ncbi:hypothetical protein STRTUCAR8_02392, partial [Streptomyces turgidiscabies Car8]